MQEEQFYKVANMTDEQEQEQDHDQGQQDEQEETMEMEVNPSPVAGPSRGHSPSPSQPSLQQAPTPGAAPHLSDNVHKRQRRPNVRLHEIGEISVEYLLDRKAGDNIKSPPGKPSRKPSLSPKFHVNDVDDADGRLPALPELSEKRNPLPKTVNKQLRLGRRHRPSPIPTTGATHPLRDEGNDDISMPKAMPGNTDGFVHVADGSVSGCSDTEKHVKLSSHKDFEVRLRGSSFKKSLKKAQSPKIKKKKMVSGKRAPAQVHAFKSEVEEKEEPLSSDVQELRTQGPVWGEKGFVPLDDQVRDWIRGIGLEKYAVIFQHHEVVNDCLPLLTMDDLKEMGIVAVGARRKLFNEIVKLKQGLMLVHDMKCE